MTLNYVKTMILVRFSKNYRSDLKSHLKLKNEVTTKALQILDRKKLIIEFKL